MSKTPEELAKEWVTITFNESDLPEDEKTEPTALEAYKTISQVAYLAGYKAAQEHAHAALEEAEATITGLSDDFENMRSLWLDRQELAVKLKAKLAAQQDQLADADKVMPDTCDHILDATKMVEPLPEPPKEEPYQEAVENIDRCERVPDYNDDIKKYIRMRVKKDAF